VLGENDDVTAHLGRDELGRLLDPADYLGATGALIDRALRAHRPEASR
jgi:hypothetical protein